MVPGVIISKVTKPLAKFQIKEIEKEYRDKVLSPKLIDFHKWVSSYNYINSGAALKLFLPNKKIIEETYSTFIYAKDTDEKTQSQDKKKILELLANEAKPKKEFLKKFNKKTTSIRSLIKNNLILEKKQKDEVKNLVILNQLNLKELSSYQKKAYKKIKDKIKKENQKPIFLDGVTGSGKTEIYFHLIKDFLRRKKQILILLPEIALSEQWLNRFKSSFSFSPLVWNSKIKIPTKRKVWNATLKQKSLVVVGARSALFLPYSNLGLIVIDEENDQSYKQEEGVIYNARDMGVVKSKIEKSSIVLVSATPSLETFKNCINQKYEWVKVKNRFKESSYPEIKIIDMKKSKSKLISEKLVLQIEKNLREKKQSLILINRRGYAPISLCAKCGIKRMCKYCDASLVFHKESDLLLCHQCGKKEILESNCVNCESKKFVLVGAGLERVYEEVKTLFENARIIKLSSDYLDKENFLQTLDEIESNNVDIIVGTQIISKGFDFANLKSVFIIDFDTWFNNADIRTNEKVFQLTQQVAGRAGRREETGEVYIQTYEPKNKLLNYIIKNQRDIFYCNELKIRSKNLLPPFAKLLLVTISSKDLTLVKDKAEKIRILFEKYKDFKVLGPIPAQVFYISKNYRLKLLVKAKNPLVIQNFLAEKNVSSYTDSKIKIKLDIDPYHLY